MLATDGMVTEKVRLLEAYAGSEINRKKARQAAVIEMRRTLGVVIVKAFAFILAPLPFPPDCLDRPFWNCFRVSAKGGGGNFI